MKNNIKRKIEEEIENKKRKEIVSFTLSKDNIEKLREEAARMSTSGSYLLDTILTNFLVLPANQKKGEENKNKK